MLHSLFPQKVFLEETQHKYFHDNGDEYMSFSKMFSFLSPKFDSNEVAGRVAQYEGVNKKDILNRWQKQTDEGTRVDNALTLYSQTGQILEEDKDLAPLIRHVLEKYKDYKKTYEQVVVYDEQYRCAGSLDKLSLISNRKDSDFIISDFKVFDKGMEYVPKGNNKWLGAPFDYLQNTKYNKICFQCSYYARLFEKLTGRKCARLFVDLIIPIKKDGNVTGYKNQVVPLMYLRNEIDLFLETFKDRILKELEVKQDIIIVNQEEEF